MRVFITGGTGTIGRNTIPHLIRNGHSVYALSRSAANEEKLRALGATPVAGDIQQLDVLEREAAASDAVIYAAFDHTTGNVPEEAKREGPAIAAVARGLARSLSLGAGDASSASAADKVLFAMNGVAFAPTDKVTTEQDELHGHFRQGALDSLAEAAKHGVRAVAVRLAMLVHTADSPHLFLDAVHGQGKKDGAVPYYGKGDTVWPAVAASDVGELIALVLAQKDKLAADKVNYVHAYTEKPTVKSIAEKIAEKQGVKTASYSDEQVKALGPFMEFVFKAGPNLSNEWTRKTFGWNPHGNSLWEDAKEGKYWGAEW